MEETIEEYMPLDSDYKQLLAEGVDFNMEEMK